MATFDVAQNMVSSAAGVELYEKVKNEDLQVKSLLDFIEFAKADIRNKIRQLKVPIYL